MVQGASGAGYLAICALVAIMTSALTLASFIKFFGVSFLSRPSTLVEASAGKGKLEVGSLMQLPQYICPAPAVMKRMFTAKPSSRPAANDVAAAQGAGRLAGPFLEAGKEFVDLVQVLIKGGPGPG